MKEICVVHLVRAHNGIEPFRRFLESYRNNPGGMEHDLLVVLKGFGPTPDATSEYREILAPFAHSILEISDEGLDITAYFAALKIYSRQYRYFCFLNSYSVILDSDWLRKLHGNICKPEVGLVGATGAWSSHRTVALARLWDFQAHFRRFQHTEIGGDRNGDLGNEARIGRLRRLGIYITHFDPFPNCHIRSNAFMISGELMEALRFPPIKTKVDAYIFESGKSGLTKKILAMGKRVLVVGKNGNGYEKEAWHESGTFWQSDQENLLIADNQTHDYDYGIPERRRYLSSLAWYSETKVWRADAG
jgi:hypothetical protein